MESHIATVIDPGVIFGEQEWADLEHQPAILVVDDFDDTLEQECNNTIRMQQSMMLPQTTQQRFSANRSGRILEHATMMQWNSLMDISNGNVNQAEIFW